VGQKTVLLRFLVKIFFQKPPKGYFHVIFEKFSPKNAKALCIDKFFDFLMNFSIFDNLSITE
jgi:hypothetical protein